MRHDDNESQQARSVREELTRLVQAHGPEILEDSRRVRAMLADAVAGATAETNLIGLALSSGIPARLREAGSSAGVIDETARDLERTSSVQSADARWAVSALAHALGLSFEAATPVEPAQPARPATPPAGGPAGGVGAPGGPPGPDDLLVRLGAREHVTKPGQVVTIGRDPASTLVLEASAVSRNHARLQRGSAGWEYHDLGSTQGSFVNGVAVQSFTLSEETEVVLGQGGESVRVRLVPFGIAMTRRPQQQRPAATPPAHTEVPGAARPGGTLAGGAARTELGSGGADGLTVTVGGQSRTIAPGAKLTVGREADNDLATQGSTVSRRHVRIEHEKGSWRLHDLGTTSGTWLAGKRVSDLVLDGRQEFVLGDAAKGDRLVTQTATTKNAAAPSTGRSKRNLPWGLLGAVAAAVSVALVIGVVAWRFVDDDDAPQASNSSPNDLLARATVRLTSDAGNGSGVVVDEKLGLILTNAHVAAPASLGRGVVTGTFADEQDPDPDELLVHVTTGLEDTAEPEFFAEVVAVDGYLDLAVLKITRKLSRTLVDDGDLESLTEVELGDSDSVRTTDSISFIGYPGAANSVAPTFTDGVVSGAVQDERLGEPRAMINTDATISGGNSGGLAVDDDGLMVGVATLNRLDDERNTVFSSFRPINLAKPIIEKAKAEEPYDTKSVVAGAANAKARGLGYARPGEPGSVGGRCQSLSRLQSLLGLSLRYSGFPGGKHTDVYAALVDPNDDDTVYARARTSYPTQLPTSGCLTLTFDRPVPQGIAYRLKVGVGGNLKVVFDAVYPNL